jgi:hypothetical protein
LRGKPCPPFLGFPTPSRSRAPVSASAFGDSRERSDRSGCYSVQEATKGSLYCAHQSQRPLLSSQERPSLQAPLRSRHPTRRHRRLTRIRRDRSRYPARSAAGDRRSAAAPQRLGTCGGPLSPADHHIDLPTQSQREQTSRSRQSRTGISAPHPGRPSRRARPDAGIPPHHQYWGESCCE